MSGPDGAAAGRRRFLASLSFAPDPFQVEGFDAVDGGRSVLVSAPTGSGKTLVAAYAVQRALASGSKAFYTTPLKALSNQKYGELVAAHGAGRVGLLTGDTSIAPKAPVVVMTTEVLRNMLLAGSDLLVALSTVVLDEVHYLQDPYRGGVWEEVLVLTPPEVRFVCLSATVSNAQELGEWLEAVRGPTDVVVETRRPITLRHHLAVTDRPSGDTTLLPLLEGSRPAPESLRLDQAARRASPVRLHGGRGQTRLPFRTPRRTELIETLDEADLLPAIVFIFSRAACDEAVRQVLRDGVRLTEPGQRRQIREMAEARVAHLSDDELAVLGFGEWSDGLRAGVASHHAGLIPAFRETVEACFAAGLLQVVFATETLSLGINMPARTVVIERFSKYGGAGRAPLTSGEYAQLTGRAGRRGLDAEGHAVVPWTAETAAGEVARIALSPAPALRSAFRPTYNLAVNLIRHFTRPQATELLHRSFAQWQSARTGRDALVAQLGRRLAVLEELGYVRGWELRPPGVRLAQIYHESDLLLAHALAGGVLDGLEPGVLAGVVAGMVFERRRARRPAGPGRPRAGRRAREVPSLGRRRQEGDRLGEKRRALLGTRAAALAECAETIRAVEEIHTVPATRLPESGIGGAIAAWTRGAPFGTVLAIAEGDVGEIAPGDFVRIAKQVADLCEQIAIAAEPATGAAATAASRLILRDVVGAGYTVPGEGVSAIADPGAP